MQLILLEKVANLGNLGDKVNVKAGYEWVMLTHPGSTGSLISGT